MKLEVIHGSRTLAKDEQQAFLASVSERMRARATQRHAEPRRLLAAPERRSVVAAMDAVEARLVKAFAVLNRSQRNPSPREASQHGIGYMLEREDKWAAAVEGGGWLSTEPAPPPAKAHEVDESDEALDWLLLIDNPAIRRLVVVVAMAKRGDVQRRIPWPRLRPKLGTMKDDPQRTLQWRYREGLRIIVTELTLARVASQC